MQLNKKLMLTIKSFELNGVIPSIRFSGRCPHLANPSDFVFVCFIEVKSKLDR